MSSLIIKLPTYFQTWLTGTDRDGNHVNELKLFNKLIFPRWEMADGRNKGVGWYTCKPILKF